jgi:uncharacterized protein YjbJ (UPF0337 family)
MGEGKKDEAIGRAKEAAGALIDDEKLRGEGRLDQAAGKVKDKVGEAVDRIREAVEPAREKDEDGS